MKTWSGFAFFVVLTALTRPLSACESVDNFKFYQEARVELDLLNQRPSADNAFNRLVLCHNLGFNADEACLDSAQKILEEYFPDENGRSPLVRAYAASLKMIRISQRSWFINGSKKYLNYGGILGKNPHKEAQEGYRELYQAWVLDQNSTIITFLKATADVQGANAFPDLLDSARIDLQRLEKLINRQDSVEVFFLHLTQAKYYLARAVETNKKEFGYSANGQLDHADWFACSEVMKQEIAVWRGRIKEWFKEIEDQED